jgi:hypothetical protein
MVLVIHIIAALSSVGLTGINYVWPSKIRLIVDYGLVAITLATATYLIWTNPKDLVSSCISGITYLTIVLIGILATQRKMARIDETA